MAAAAQIPVNQPPFQAPVKVTALKPFLQPSHAPAAQCANPKGVVMRTIIITAAACEPVCAGNVAGRGNGERSRGSGPSNSRCLARHLPAIWNGWTHCQDGLPHAEGMGRDTRRGSAIATTRATARRAVAHYDGAPARSLTRLRRRRASLPCSRSTVGCRAR